MRLWPRSWPIAVKMSIDLLLAALVPLGLALVLTGGESHRQLDKSARDNLFLLARVTASRLDQLLQDTARMVQLLSRDDSAAALCGGDSKTRKDLAETVQRQLQSVLDTNPDFASIFLTDAGGIGLVGTNNKIVGMDFKFREYYRDARQGNAHVSEVIVPKSQKDPGVYFSAPIRQRGKNGSAAVAGVIVLELRAQSFLEMIDEGQSNLKGYALLVDQHGVILAHPRRDLLYHSLAPLLAETIAEIDPQTTYNQPSIESLNLFELVPVLDSPLPAGSASFLARRNYGRSEREAWVTGFARLKNKPWMVFVMQPETDFAVQTSRTTDLVRLQVLVGLIVAVCAATLAVWRARSLVRPVLAINKAAHLLAHGDFHARAEKFGDDEIGQLADSFNTMVPELQHSVTLQQSMAIAREVQQSLLPAEDPKLARLDVAGRSKYCDSTGGDYFDYIDVADPAEKTTLIAVGDVMGHGIASALVMASARAALRTQAMDGGQLSSLMNKVNRFLATDTHNRFMTLVLVRVEPARGVVHWTSAGHDPILLYQPESGQFTELSDGEVPLGLDVSTSYHEHQHAGVKAGDVLLIGTDGLWETPDGHGQQFGKERLREILRAMSGESAALIADAIEKKLTEFCGAGKLTDDVTFVVAKMR